MTNILKNFPYSILDLFVALTSYALRILSMLWFKNKTREHIAPCLRDKNCKQTCSVRPKDQRHSQAI
jgi:hypothetical protein